MKKTKLQIQKLVLEGLKNKIREEEENKNPKSQEKEDEGEGKDLDIEIEDEELDIDGVEVEGDGDIIGNLQAALESARELGDEKLVDQIGNTITFYTRTHIVGGQEELEEEVGGDFASEDEKEDYYQNLDDVNENHIRDIDVDSGLTITPKGKTTLEDLMKVLDDEELYYEANYRENILLMPEELDQYDDLEKFLDKILASKSFDYTVEGIFESQNSPHIRDIEDEIFYIWDDFFEDGRRGISKGNIGNGKVRFEFDYSGVDKYDIEPFETAIQQFLNLSNLNYDLDFGMLTVDLNTETQLDESFKNFSKLAGILKG